MLAFGLDTYGGAAKNDERYVKWIARSETRLANGEITHEYHKVRKCTDKDWSKFSEPKKSIAPKFYQLKGENGLYCLELKGDKVNLFSSWVYDGEYSILDLLALPCGT